LILAASVVGASETAAFFKKRGVSSSAALPLICGALFPIAAYLEISGLLIPEVARLVLPLALWAILLREIFVKTAEEIKGALGRSGANLVVALYPGAFAAYLIRMGGLPMSEVAYLIFFVSVFMNDSMAYVFGVLFGKGNRGIFPASENKSVVGLVSGLLFSVGSAVVFYLFFPDFFNSSIALAFVVGGSVGVAAVAGDLVVSTLKRSAGLKDSGKIIPGRGGMLDSIDSVVFAAPVFYLLIRYFAQS
jgi:phosphatidate cytidylyltransferase